MNSLKLRKKKILNLVQKIQENYPTDSGIDYNSLCSDLSITKIASPKIFQGELKYHLNGGVHILVPSQNRKLEKYSTAHELGHLLLEHDKYKFSPVFEEREADFFAINLTKMSYAEYLALSIVDVSLFMLKHPLLTFKYLTNHYDNHHLKLSQKHEASGGTIYRKIPCLKLENLF